MSIPPEASGPVLAASSPMRIGPLFWASAMRGATTLAIPAPAAELTNCRRDIGTADPPVMFPRLLFFFLLVLVVLVSCVHVRLLRIEPYDFVAG
jgi:hypothetical protein